MPSSTSTTRDFVPEIDGLRALSVIFVMLTHASYGRLQGGILGVDIFFVISGYLITRLMMLEHRATGRIDLPEFYLRRVFRILPPLIACLILALCLWNGPPADRWPVAASALLFFANFLPAEMLGSLGHTWSLAIEEQFYLVWPVVFIAATKRSLRPAAVIAAMVIVAAIVTRAAILAAGYPAVLNYTFTPARVDGLMVGCLLAIVETPLARRVPRYALAPMAYAAAAAIFGALFLVSRAVMQEQPLAFTIFALCAGTAIFAIPRLGEPSPLRRFLAGAPARYVGRRSYGLYLYHYPIFHAAESFRIAGDRTNFALVAAGEILVSLIVAEISWHILERPLQRVKKRFSWRRLAPAPGQTLISERIA